jgi:hypothetical protein
MCNINVWSSGLVNMSPAVTYPQKTKAQVSRVSCDEMQVTLEVGLPLYCHLRKLSLTLTISQCNDVKWSLSALHGFNQLNDSQLLNLFTCKWFRHTFKWSRVSKWLRSEGLTAVFQRIGSYGMWRCAAELTGSRRFEASWCIRLCKSRIPNSALPGSCHSTVKFQLI